MADFSKFYHEGKYTINMKEFLDLTIPDRQELFKLMNAKEKKGLAARFSLARSKAEKEGKSLPPTLLQATKGDTEGIPLGSRSGRSEMPSDLSVQLLMTAGLEKESHIQYLESCIVEGKDLEVVCRAIESGKFKTKHAPWVRKAIEHSRVEIVSCFGDKTHIIENTPNLLSHCLEKKSNGDMFRILLNYGADFDKDLLHQRKDGKYTGDLAARVIESGSSSLYERMKDSLRRVDVSINSFSTHMVSVACYSLENSYSISSYNIFEDIISWFKGEKIAGTQSYYHIQYLCKSGSPRALEFYLQSFRVRKEIIAQALGESLKSIDSWSSSINFLKDLVDWKDVAVLSASYSDFDPPVTFNSQVWKYFDGCGFTKEHLLRCIAATIIDNKKRFSDYRREKLAKWMESLVPLHFPCKVVQECLQMFISPKEARQWLGHGF